MYIVIEMQTNEGVTTTLTYQFDTLALAEQKYYYILAAATTSEVGIHAAVIMDQKGCVIKNDYYEHNVEPKEE